MNAEQTPAEELYWAVTEARIARTTDDLDYQADCDEAWTAALDRAFRAGMTREAADRIEDAALATEAAR